VSLTHHALCFGCGPANLFGLQVELERRDEGAVAGRFFLKQDHQGQDGSAHPGILGAALQEALTHARGEAPDAVALEMLAPAPVGVFVELEATPEEAIARLADDGNVVARGTTVSWPTT
jgi:hypothetical protein